MADLTLFHTAEVHCATFDALAARIAPGVRLTHVVRPDWLARAQNGIDADLAAEITAALAEAPVALCTCTTIGSVAERAGALRIDAPMMQAAARSGGPVLLVCCLESTRAPSTALLEAAFAAEGTPVRIAHLDLSDLWPLFTEGDGDPFADEIARRVESALAAQPDLSAVVLAQASMAGAQARVRVRSDVPVLASPELALRAALKRAGA